MPDILNPELTIPEVDVDQNTGLRDLGSDYLTKYGFHDPEEYFHKGDRRASWRERV